MSLQSKVLKYLKRQPGIWVIKVVIANERGCPDILCCVNGRFLAIEIKEGNDSLSKIQAVQLQLIHDAEGATYVLHSPYGLESLQKEIERLLQCHHIQS